MSTIALRNLILAVGLGAVGLIACQPSEDEVKANANAESVDPSAELIYSTSSSGYMIYKPPPAPDADGDGIPDKYDACPNTPGWKDPDKAKYGCPVSYCDPVSVDDYYGDKVPGNTRIALVDANGLADCIPAEALEGKPSKCKVPEKEIIGVSKKLGARLAQSGLTIDDGSGKYFVLSAKVKFSEIVTKDPITGDAFTWGRRSVNCAAKPGYDVAGQVPASGEELAGACVLETLNADKNSTGLEQNNYATKEVCWGTAYVNADADEMARSYGSYQCTKGEGAALNDLNGTERDAYNVYRTGWTACHHAWYNGYEVPAAKRPATAGYPAKVTPTSPVLWRTVASNVPIAN